MHACEQVEIQRRFTGIAATRQQRDGAFGVNKDGKFFVWIRYDLPESMNSLVLVPNGSGIDYKAKIAAGETPTHENEDIVLLK